MFKGFRLKKVDFGIHESFYRNLGRVQYETDRNIIKKELALFLNNDNSLDGSRLIEEWFPAVKSHIFLSHSHSDNSEVLALAGWLYHNFNITSFIDSCIWGYGRDLIKMLDDKYSPIEGKEGVYYYDKVLDSAGHVHIMLSSALNLMIDRTECVLFYDTPNSIKSFPQSDKTESPWIFSEITFSQVVQRRIPGRLQKLIEATRQMSKGPIDHFEELRITYDLNSRHLINIDDTTLTKWAAKPHSSPEKSLENLYEITQSQSEGIIYG